MLEGDPIEVNERDHKALLRASEVPQYLRITNPAVQLREDAEGVPRKVIHPASPNDPPPILTSLFSLYLHGISFLPEIISYQSFVI